MLVNADDLLGVNYYALHADKLSARDSALCAGDGAFFVELLKGTAFEGATATTILAAVHTACLDHPTISQALKLRSTNWLAAHG